MPDSRILAWASTHQVSCYLLAVLGGAALGLGSLRGVEAVESAITPCLIVLLFITFLEVPLEAVREALTDVKFLATVLGVNFLLVPGVVAVLYRVAGLDPAVEVPALIVLLTPCIDYVIVFTRLAGGASGKLLAMTPLLLLVQIILLPVLLWAVTGGAVTSSLPVAPFLGAIVTFILLPFVAAAAARMLGRRFTAVRTALGAASGFMVVIMALTLAVIAAAIAPALGSVGDLVRPALVFAVFALVMAGLGWLSARFLRFGVPETRALIFTGVTRNSLVVLPIVRALDPDGMGPAVVVTQTMVELIVMVALVQFLGRSRPVIAVSENR